MKLFRKIGVCLMAFSMLCTVVCAETRVATAEELIFSEDFSGSVSGYGASTGTAENGAYKLAAGQRLLKQSTNYSAGAFSLKATFTFSGNGRTESLLTSCDSGGGANDYAYRLRNGGDGAFMLDYWAEGETAATNATLSKPALNTPYTIEVRFSLDTREMMLFINGDRQLADRLLLVNPAMAALHPTKNMARWFDIRNHTAGAEFTVDDIEFKKIAWDSRANAAVLFSDNFENGLSGYTAMTGTVADNINGSKALYMESGNRLTKRIVSANAPKQGRVHVSFDLAFPGTLTDLGGGDGNPLLAYASSDATNPGGTGDNDKSRATAFRIFFEQNKNVVLEHSTTNGTDSATGKQTATVSRRSLFTATGGAKKHIDVEFDIDTAIMTAAVDGKAIETSSPMYMFKLKDYQGVCDADHRNSDTNHQPYYLDNICVTHFNPDGGYTQNKMSDSFDSGSSQYLATQAGTPVFANGTMTMSSGARVIHSKTVTSGVWSASADLKFTNLTPSSSYKLIAGAEPDTSTAHYFFQLMEKGGDLYVRAILSKTDRSNAAYFRILENVAEADWLHIQYTVDLSTRRVYLYLNGSEILAEHAMYMDADADAKIARPFEMDFRSLSHTVEVDNYAFWEDTLTGGLGVSSGYVTENLTLPNAVGGQEVVWSTDNAAVIDAEGNVTRGETDQTVVLTASAADGAYKKSVPFTMIVPKQGRVGAIEAKNAVISAIRLPSAPDGSILILCRYDSENKLVDCKLAADGAPISYSTSDKLNGVHKLRAFVWDSAANLKPCGTAEEKTITVSNGADITE